MPSAFHTGADGPRARRVQAYSSRHGADHRASPATSAQVTAAPRRSAAAQGTGRRDPTIDSSRNSAARCCGSRDDTIRSMHRRLPSSECHAARTPGWRWATDSVMAHRQSSSGRPRAISSSRWFCSSSRLSARCRSGSGRPGATRAARAGAEGSASTAAGKWSSCGAAASPGGGRAARWPARSTRSSTSRLLAMSDFDTKPRAPTCSALGSISAGSCWLTITISEAGDLRRMTAAASSPPRRGMLTSSSTMSGCSRAAFSTASSAVGGLAAHLPRGTRGEERPQSLAHQLVVVSNENAYASHVCLRSPDCSFAWCNSIYARHAVELFAGAEHATAASAGAEPRTRMAHAIAGPWRSRQSQ